MRLKKGYTLRELGETHILINEGETADLTRVLPMNDSATLLWKKAEGKDFDEEWLAQQLIDEYQIDSETAAKGARSMVANWKKFNLLAEE